MLPPVNTKTKFKNKVRGCEYNKVRGFVYMQAEMLPPVNTVPAEILEEFFFPFFFLFFSLCIYTGGDVTSC